MPHYLAGLPSTMRSSLCGKSVVTPVPFFALFAYYTDYMGMCKARARLFFQGFSATKSPNMDS